MLKPKDRLSRQKLNSKTDFSSIVPTSVWTFIRQLQLAEMQTDSRQGDVEVWSCGQNIHGELAHDGNLPTATYASIGTLRGVEISQVSAGNLLCALPQDQ